MHQNFRLFLGKLSTLSGRTSKSRIVRNAAPIINRIAISAYGRKLFLGDGIKRNFDLSKLLLLNRMYRMTTKNIKRTGMTGNAKACPVILFVANGNIRKKTGIPRNKSINSVINRVFEGE